MTSNCSSHTASVLTSFVLFVQYLKLEMVSNSDLLLQFAVLYEARSNTGIDRMKIINAVAKSVPQPHKVDLKNPDKTIIVQIAKVNAFIFCTVGLIHYASFLVLEAAVMCRCKFCSYSFQFMFY